MLISLFYKEYRCCVLAFGKGNILFWFNESKNSKSKIKKADITARQIKNKSYEKVFFT